MTEYGYSQPVSRPPCPLSWPGPTQMGPYLCSLPAHPGTLEQVSQLQAGHGIAAETLSASCQLHPAWTDSCL